MTSSKVKRGLFLLVSIGILLIGGYHALTYAFDYRIDSGNLYRIDSVLGSRTFVKKLYDTDFYRKNYVLVDGKPHVKDPRTGKLYSTRRYFKDGFEDAKTIHDLIDLTRWSHFTVQSPAAPTVKDYNQLRKRILNGTGDFVDNRVEPNGEQVHQGSRALKTRAVAPTSGMSTCKAAIHASLFHFVKGDDVWFSGWYYIKKRGRYNTLMDLESTWVDQHPGMRIVLNDGHLEFQLAKWLPNITYRPTKSKRKAMPVGQWVHIKSRLRLSDGPDGIIQLWQDGELLIDQRGQTLPFASAVLDDFEIGLSAHSNSSDEAVLYVDDLVLSATPIN